MLKYKIDPIGYNQLIKERDYSVSRDSSLSSSSSSSSGKSKCGSTNCSLIGATGNKDTYNIIFLMFLYFLQGIPLGLKASLPFLLSSRRASYSQQALFSLASWPFSLKLLWAPVVDSIYSRSIGRRKSWLVPVQYLIGFFMLFFANYVYTILEQKHSVSNEDITILTSIFFLFTFLSATQDIAVDGWGLTILSKDNLHWASICNNAGSTTGMLVGNSIFLLLESTEFSNYYIRPYFGLPIEPNDGIINLRVFMKFFGAVFIVSTTLILLLKKERENDEESSSSSSTSTPIGNKNLTISQTFKLLWNILKLGPVQKFCLILFTCKIAFATYSARYLKLIEAGVPKETLGVINGGFQIIQILTPLLIGRLLNLSKPLYLFFKTYPMRMVMTVFLTIWVFYTPLFRDDSGQYPFNYFVFYILLNGIYALIFSTQAVAKTAFFTHISDKAIGGTYMTLMNTVANIGVHWPSTLALYLIDVFSLRECNLVLRNQSIAPKSQANFLLIIHENTCSTDLETITCLKNGAECIVKIDAFYYLTALCTLIGIFWLVWFKRTIFNLQSLPKAAWRISSVVSLKKPQQFI